MNHPPGLILLNKPAGITSFQCLGPIKRAVGTKRIGHCGTLDRFASGLMILLSGKATKLVPAFTAMDKRYRARILFGAETETLDPEGSVVATADLPTRERVLAAIEQFTGRIAQVPPAYSAVHVAGKRAYERVRAGEDVKLASREVEVFSILVHEIGPDFADLTVHCSKGTYIRSLARDIALAAGTRGHLGMLERLSIGSFTIEESVAAEDFSPEEDIIHGRALAQKVPGSAVLDIDPNEARELRFGRLPPDLPARASDLAHPRLVCLVGDELVAMLANDQGIRIDWVVPGAEV